MELEDSVLNNVIQLQEDRQHILLLICRSELEFLDVCV